MSAFINDWLPYIVLIVTYFAISTWLSRRKARRDAAQIKAIQDSMIAAYKERHGESE